MRCNKHRYNPRARRRTWEGAAGGATCRPTCRPASVALTDGVCKLLRNAPAHTIHFFEADAPMGHEFDRRRLGLRLGPQTNALHYIAQRIRDIPLVLRRTYVGEERDPQ